MDTVELTAKIRQYKEFQRMQEELEEQMEAVKNAIKGEMTTRNVEELTAGEYKVRWTVVESSRLDTKALREALPEVADRFSVTSKTKRFTVL